MKSDFPEFDKAYNEILLPEDADYFNHVAAATRFNIYNSPIWRVQGRKFAETVVKECCRMMEDNLTVEDIKQQFNIVD
jgi:hypothetical protein